MQGRVIIVGVEVDQAPGDFDVYVYKVDCEHGAVRETISFDAQGKIGGIYVAPWDS